MQHNYSRKSLRVWRGFRRVSLGRGGAATVDRVPHRRGSINCLPCLRVSFRIGVAEFPEVYQTVYSQICLDRSDALRGFPPQVKVGLRTEKRCACRRERYLRLPPTGRSVRTFKNAASAHGFFVTRTMSVPVASASRPFVLVRRSLRTLIS